MSASSYEAGPGEVSSEQALEALLKSGHTLDQSPVRLLRAQLIDAVDRARAEVCRPPVLVAGCLLLVAALGFAFTARGRGSAQPIEARLPRASASGSGAGSSVAASAGLSESPSSTTLPSLVVDVGGAVARPGLVTLPPGSRLADALAQVGGATPDADLERVNRAAPLVDGAHLYVPRRGQQDVPTLVDGVPAAAPSGTGIGGAASPGVPASPLDLNAATAEQLESLPGVGPSTAAAIVDYRTQHGRFRSVDGLLEVRGIGEAKLSNIRPHVRV